MKEIRGREGLEEEGEEGEEGRQPCSLGASHKGARWNRLLW